MVADKKAVYVTLTGDLNAEFMEAFKGNKSKLINDALAYMISNKSIFTLMKHTKNSAINLDYFEKHPEVFKILTGSDLASKEQRVSSVNEQGEVEQKAKVIPIVKEQSVTPRQGVSFSGENSPFDID